MVGLDIRSWKSVFLPKNKAMNPKGNPNIVEAGEATRLKPGCCSEIQSKGVEAAVKVIKEKATFRLEYSALLDMFARMEDLELVKLKEEWGLDKITNRQCIVAASVELARRPTAAGTAERRLIYDNMGEMTNKMEVQLSPYEYLAKVRELRENEQ